MRTPHLPTNLFQLPVRQQLVELEVSFTFRFISAQHATYTRHSQEKQRNSINLQIRKRNNGHYAAHENQRRIIDSQK